MVSILPIRLFLCIDIPVKPFCRKNFEAKNVVSMCRCVDVMEKLRRKASPLEAEQDGFCPQINTDLH